MVELIKLCTYNLTAEASIPQYFRELLMESSTASSVSGAFLVIAAS